MSVVGRVFDIQRYSVQDGPGIRTTVFMKGCPLSCLWCSNPESQSKQLQLGVRHVLCDRCGLCLEKCPEKAIFMSEAEIQIDRQRCNNCFECVGVCAPAALKVLGGEVPVGEVLAVVKRDHLYYRNSGGGVTASGGEPLAQARFVAELFRRCRDIGIHTTLDTSGMASAEDLESVLAYTDLVLFDIKLMSEKLHQEIVGASNKRIIENVKDVVQRGIPIIIRVPLIPGFTDCDENVDDIARFVVEDLGGAPVNVLPYHRFGTNKYKMIDLEYPLADVRPPPKEAVGAIVKRFEAFGLNCEIVS